MSRNIFLVTELPQIPCDDDLGVTCNVCYSQGYDEWRGTVPATTQVTPPNGLEEFVCDWHATYSAYDERKKRLVETRGEWKPLTGGSGGITGG